MKGLGKWFGAAGQKIVNNTILRRAILDRPGRTTLLVLQAVVTFMPSIITVPALFIAGFTGTGVVAGKYPFCKNMAEVLEV